MKSTQFDWSKIPLGRYAEIDALSRAHTTNPLANDITMLSLVTGKDEKFFEEEIHLTQLSKERQKLHKFLNQEMKAKYFQTFKCNGRKYKVSQSMEEFNGGQLEAISALQLTDENFASKSHFTMAILCNEKKTWKFWRKELPIQERAKEFEQHLPTSIGIGIINFFFLYSTHLYPIVLEKIKKDTEKIMEQMKN